MQQYHTHTTNNLSSVVAMEAYTLAAVLQGAGAHTLTSSRLASQNKALPLGAAAQHMLLSNAALDSIIASKFMCVVHRPLLNVYRRYRVLHPDLSRQVRHHCLQSEYTHAHGDYTHV